MCESREDNKISHPHSFLPPGFWYCLICLSLILSLSLCSLSLSHSLTLKHTHLLLKESIGMSRERVQEEQPGCAGRRRRQLEEEEEEGDSHMSALSQTLHTNTQDAQVNNTHTATHTQHSFTLRRVEHGLSVPCLTLSPYTHKSHGERICNPLMHFLAHIHPLTAGMS